MPELPIDLRQISFATTDFSTLMQKRIYRILIVCSNYDFFILEEDGRIEEQIFNEYNALNFRFPPVVLHADTAEEASYLLSTMDIDLIIFLLNPYQSIPISWVSCIKQDYPQIPLVTLVYYSHELTNILNQAAKAYLEPIFCWMGNADLLVAIIKLLEDRFNADHDIQQVGVQAIMIVEDSIKYISIMLPMIYKIVVWQSQELAKEGLNEHQKMLRLRGRPKILLCKTFDEAIQTYEKYSDNLLGIITDVNLKSSFPENREETEGIALCKWVRERDPFLPIILQSTEVSNSTYAERFKVGFIDKQSKTLPSDYKKYLTTHFAFGDFVFRNPGDGSEYKRVVDLYELQHAILSIPDEIFAFHARRNDFSKWLNARALFSLGKIFKNLRLTDFSNNIPEAKKFVYEAIAQYRISKSRGVIAQYERQEFDEFVTFSRIGSGSIGGKGRGLAFADSVLKKNIHLNQFENTLIGIPRTVVIATDIFDEFMELNNLYSTAIGNYNDQEIFEKFIAARLPEHLMVDLQNYLKGVRKPIAVRSSSKLEDSQLLPFAGVYKTFMIPNVEKDVNRTLKILSEAIKCVYASLFYKETKAYFQSTGNNLMEEKMAVILQEVCGQKCCNLYFPLLSGVALSYNYYALPPETVEDGIAHIACGLGKYVVEGNQSFRFSPKHPQHALIHASTELFLKNQQRKIYALSLEPDAWKPSIDDTVNFVQIKPEDMLLHPGKSLIASKYDINNHQIVDNLLSEGKTIITFNGILKHRVVPLANILSELLETFEKELHAPVEIEFALETNPNELRKFQFYLLQLRPMYPNQRTYPVELPDITNTQTILAYSEHALGNGIFFNISDVVYVLPEKFDPSKTLLMAEEINSWNNLLKQQHKNYVLIGPGRWGSSDPWLGIPIRWHQISEAKIIIESLTENHPVDFSQGTHLFYNLISSGVIFMMIDQKQNPEFINFELLNSVGIHEDKEYTRWVHFEQPFTVITDGRKHKSIITF